MCLVGLGTVKDAGEVEEGLVKFEEVCGACLGCRGDLRVLAGASYGLGRMERVWSLGVLVGASYGSWKGEMLPGSPSWRLGILAGASGCLMASSWRRGLPTGRRPGKDARLPGLLIGSDRHNRIYSCVKVIRSVYHADPCAPSPMLPASCCPLLSLPSHSPSTSVPSSPFPSPCSEFHAFCAPSRTCVVLSCLHASNFSSVRIPPLLSSLYLSAPFILTLSRLVLNSMRSVPLPKLPSLLSVSSGH